MGKEEKLLRLVGGNLLQRVLQPSPLFMLLWESAVDDQGINGHKIGSIEGKGVPRGPEPTRILRVERRVDFQFRPPRSFDVALVWIIDVVVARDGVDRYLQVGHGGLESARGPCRWFVHQVAAVKDEINTLGPDRCQVVDKHLTALDGVGPDVSIGDVCELTGAHAVIHTS